MLVLQSNKKLLPQTRIVREEDYAGVMQADAIVAEAKQKAQKIIQQADLQAQLIAREAQANYEAEKSRGLQEGTTISQQKQLEMLFRMLSGGIKYLALLEDTFVHTIRLVTEKIFGEYSNDERILALVKTALKTLPAGKYLKIHVQPGQTIALKAKIKELAQCQPNQERIEIESDGTLKLDQCILETETGILDASLDVQFPILIKAIESIIH